MLEVVLFLIALALVYMLWPLVWRLAVAAIVVVAAILLYVVAITP